MQCGLWLYSNQGLSFGKALIHFMNLLIGLGDKLHLGPFLNPQRKFLLISRHDAGRGSQQHNGHKVFFLIEGAHDFKGGGKGNLRENGFVSFFHGSKI